MCHGVSCVNRYSSVHKKGNHNQPNHKCAFLSQTIRVVQFSKPNFESTKNYNTFHHFGVLKLTLATDAVNESWYSEISLHHDTLHKIPL